MTENRTTKTYYSEVYEPMRKRELEKANKELLKDVKKFIKSDRGWGSRKRIEAYKKKRLQEYYDIAWDYQLDIFTFLYIVRSNTDKEGFVRITLSIENDDETGKITKYDIGDTERGWESIKEKTYDSYLQTHEDTIESKL